MDENPEYSITAITRRSPVHPKHLEHTDEKKNEMKKSRESIKRFARPTRGQDTNSAETENDEETSGGWAKNSRKITKHISKRGKFEGYVIPVYLN